MYETDVEGVINEEGEVEQPQIIDTFNVKLNDVVNIEFDILAKYIRKALK